MKIRREPRDIFVAAIFGNSILACILFTNDINAICIFIECVGNTQMCMANDRKLNDIECVEIYAETPHTHSCSPPDNKSHYSNMFYLRGNIYSENWFKWHVRLVPFVYTISISLNTYGLCSLKVVFCLFVVHHLEFPCFFGKTFGAKCQWLQLNRNQARIKSGRSVIFSHLFYCFTHSIKLFTIKCDVNSVIWQACEWNGE